MLEMRVPSPGESITEVEIASWLVSDGDYVEKDQAIAEVDSDKATLELPAEASGVITLKAEEGEVVEVGQVVCLIDTSADKPEGATTTNAAPKQEKQQTTVATPSSQSTNYATGTPSPAARKILDEKGLAPSQVQGTGINGRITKEDAVQANAAMGAVHAADERGAERKKLSSLRRKVAERLVSVKNETAMLTTFNEVDMSAIFELRKQYKEAFKEKHGVSLGFMSFFTKAVVKSLQEFPDVNSMIDGDYKVTFDYQDISIAVSGPKGLMVPVLRNAQDLSFSGIELGIKDLAIKVRDNKISIDEMTGGTFTITNGGVFGSMLSTPIINPPQSGILGMHNIVERPVVKDGKIEIAPVMFVALSYDHRIIDGRESVGFLVNVKEALENPLELLMDNDAKKALEL